MNGLHIHLNANAAQRGDRWVKLSATEAEFATILHRAEGRAVSRAQIMRGLYGVLAKDKNDQIARNLARHTRQKLNHLGATIECDIEADGYRLVVTEERV